MAHFHCDGWAVLYCCYILSPYISSVEYFYGHLQSVSVYTYYLCGHLQSVNVYKYEKEKS